MAKRKSQSDHDKMVKYVADFYIKKNHPNVKADIQGYNKPDVIKWRGQNSGHIPDVTTGNSILVEVETDDSINDTHTKDQWTLFSTYAQEHKIKFYIVVPKGSEQKAENRKVELGVKGEVVGL